MRRRAHAAAMAAAASPAAPADEFKLSEAEQKEFDAVSYDAIQEIADVGKLQRLERYMRAEGFGPTADAALARLRALGADAVDTFALSQRVTSTADREATDVLEELRRWEADAKRNDSALNASEAGARDAGAAPVRTIVRPTVSHTPLPAESEADERTNDKKGQIQGGKDYFDRWDKFAKDEVSKVEADDEREAREAAERLAGKRRAAAAAAARADSAGAEALGESAFAAAVASAAAMSPQEAAFAGDAEKDKGNEEFRAREFSAAVRCYTLSLLYKPGVAATHCNRAAAYLKLKRYEDVVTDCNSALSFQPGYVKALSRRGAAYLELGKPAEALADLRAAAAAHPSAELSRLIDRAAREHEQELEKKGLNRKTRIMIAEDSDSDEDADGARASTSTAAAAQGRTKLVIEEDGSESDGEPQPARATGATQRTKLVIEEESDDEEGGQESAEVLSERERERGNALFKEGKLEAALDAYTASASHKPTAAAHANAALVLLRLHRAAEAEAQATRALQIESGHVKALHRRASARHMLNDLDGAAADYKVVVKALPNEPTVRKEAKAVERAIDLRDLKANGTSRLMEMRKGPMVIEELEEDEDKEDVVPPPRPAPTPAAPKPEPTPKPRPKPEPESDPASAPMREQEAAGTKPAQASAMPVEPTPAENSTPTRGGHDTSAAAERKVQAKVHQELGNRHFREKRLKEAVECYTTSLQLAPTAAVHSNRALCRMNLGDARGCAEDCDAALELDSGYVKALHRRANARMQLGDALGALADLRMVEKELPNNAKVKRELSAAEAAVAAMDVGGAQGSVDRKKIPTTEVAQSDDEGVKHRPQAAAPAEVEAQEDGSTRAARAPLVAAREEEHSGTKQEIAEEVVETVAAATKLAPTTPPAPARAGPARTPSPTAAAAAAKAAGAARAAAMTPPRTPTDFERSMATLRDDPKTAQEFVLSIPPDAYKQLFRDALSGAAIASVADAHGAACSGEHATGEAAAATAAAEALLALSAVNRFSMAVMLLGKAEKARVKAAIDAVAAAGADAERMSLVRQRYRIE